MKKNKPCYAISKNFFEKTRKKKRKKGNRKEQDQDGKCLTEFSTCQLMSLTFSLLCNSHRSRRRSLRTTTWVCQPPSTMTATLTWWCDKPGTLTPTRSQQQQLIGQISTAGVKSDKTERSKIIPEVQGGEGGGGTQSREGTPLGPMGMKCCKK